MSSIEDSELLKLNSNWSYPTDIRFGCGRINELADICKSLGVNKPLLVTDAGLAKFDFVIEIIKQNREKGLEISLYSDVKPNPGGDDVTRGVHVFKKGKCDGVIALGGGSGLDAGKAIALMVGQTEEIWKYEDKGENWLRVNEDLIVPCIAVPTTSGTGSEVGRAAVIVDEEKHIKKIIFHPKMLPDVVIADAGLTQGLPSHITAATGMDAFVHCLEAYCAPAYHPMADGIAVQGMLLIKKWLPVAYKDGNNLVARSHMLVASTMGATAFQKGLGAVHALAHPLGAVFDKHHGLLNAILLPYVLVKNKKLIEEKIQQLAICLGVIESSDQNSFDLFLKWLLEFRNDLGIPDHLKSLGIGVEKAELISEMAVADPSASGNPIAFTKEQYKEIFENAVTGKLG